MSIAKEPKPELPAPDESRSFASSMVLLTFWASAFAVAVAATLFLVMRPKFEKTFRDFQAELPPMTNFCLQVPSEFVIGIGLVWIVVLAIVHWAGIHPWVELTGHAISLAAIVLAVVLVCVAFLMPLSNIATNLNLQQ